MRPLLLVSLLLLGVLALPACEPPPEGFAHSALTEAHEAAPCSGCHGDSLDGSVETECAACHAAPEGHSDDACDLCHEGDRWDGAAFEHALPLPHQGEIDLCAACHPEGEHGRVDCLSCHEHRPEAVSPPHEQLGIPGYAFKTDACLRCHPDGRVH